MKEIEVYFNIPYYHFVLKRSSFLRQILKALLDNNSTKRPVYLFSDIKDSYSAQFSLVCLQYTR